MRKSIKTKFDGVTRMLQSAAVLRRQQGLCGKPESYDQAYAYLKKRTHGIQYRHCRSQSLPIGSGITKALARLSSRSGSSARRCRGRERAAQASVTYE